MTKKPKLTPKQIKFVKGVAEGKSQTQAALEAYDTTSIDVAKNIGSDNLTKPNVREALDIAMVKLNLTPERALKPIDDALNDDDVKTRLMGSDRALKLMQPKESGGININFNNITKNDSDEFNIQ
jgi:phage terminase small subunit